MKNKLYLGIDVSKGYADLIMLNAARKVVGKPFQLYDVSEDHKSLAQYTERSGVYPESRETTHQPRIVIPYLNNPPHTSHSGTRSLAECIRNPDQKLKLLSASCRWLKPTGNHLNS